jgi:hypothetical protein
MHPQVMNALKWTEEIRPIRSCLSVHGWYHLSAANGERRINGAGTANSVLANAGWPHRGRNALLWCAAAQER